MLACDFFHVDCALTLQRISVFFVLEVPNRVRAPAGYDHEPRRPMDHPADPQPGDGSRRPRHPVPVPRLRPRRTVHRVVGCCPGRHRDPRGADSSSLPACELLCRTVRAHPQGRTHRSNVDLQSAASACGAHEVRSALPRSTATPGPRTSPTTPNASRSRPQL
jgi:hypothetical protein